MKIIVDGEFDARDETGKSVKGGKGDVFFSLKGVKIIFRIEKEPGYSLSLHTVSAGG